MAERKIQKALVSVTDKSGVAQFCRALHDIYGTQIISTGGTAKVLEEAGVPVTEISEYTGFPEMMGGRVKTLHPKVHGGLLARRDSAEHMEEAAAHDIPMIDLVCVNLYEFEKTVAKPDVTFADAVEHIDIGGPSMLRSAAKNAQSVTVVCDPADYGRILDDMAAHDGATSLELRLQLQVKAYTTTAAYDTAISNWLAGQLIDAEGAVPTQFPERLTLAYAKQQDLRYGENPHQAAAFYRDANAAPHSLACATQLNGKPLSYNNLLDTDAAWSAVREFDEPACIILKHQNPCGSAVAANVTEAYDKAYACDPVSAFGGIIACNREVPLELVEHFADVNKQFVEVLIAPSFTPEALERLSRRKNLRVLATGGVDAPAAQEMRTVDGGLLVQDVDHVTEKPADYQVVTRRAPTAQELHDLEFGWKVVKTVKSNAILIAKDDAGIGMGPGQPNRVDSAIIACDRAHKACERMGVAPENLAAASDAFFPFRDDVDELAARGVTAIVQPGGSVRDEEVIAACDEHNIAMVFTGRRHFRH